MGDFYQSSLGSSDFADPKNASAHQRCILLSEDLHIYIYITGWGGYSIYKYVSCIDKNPEFFRIPRSYYGSK